MNDRVYIHEFIDIIAHQRSNYMQHMTANWSPIGQEERDQSCYGVWALLGSTGAWPKTVNMWEHAGWSGLAASFAVETVGKGAQDPALEKWWAEAAKFRSGGYDRIMIPAPWTQTIEELCADGVRGEVYAHEIVSVANGAAGDYLEVIAGSGVDAYAEFGISLVGAFATAMRSEGEVILIWAIPSWADWADFEQASMRRDGLSAWKEAIRPFGGYTYRTLMVDAPLAPLRTGRQPQVEDRRPLAEL